MYNGKTALTSDKNAQRASYQITPKKSTRPAELPPDPVCYTAGEHQQIIINESFTSQQFTMLRIMRGRRNTDAN